MSLSETSSRLTADASELEAVERGEGWFKVQHRQTGNICTIMDTFAEMFPIWAGRVLITAESEKWALTAAKTATGFATSVVMAPAEAGLEAVAPPGETPDGRVGALIQVYHQTRTALRAQMMLRVGQCVMTCPTTAAFDALPKARRRLHVGRSLRLFGDGFQRRDTVGGRRVWRIPVMEGEFTVEDSFGAVRAVAGGTILIMAGDQGAGLRAAEEAVGAISQAGGGVILPFPGGVCRSGSKLGSRKYKLVASTNDPLCPRLRKLVPNSQVPDGVHSIYEIVINGLTLDAVKGAMARGIRAAVKVPGVVRISAANFGGKLGPYRAPLREVLGL